MNFEIWQSFTCTHPGLFILSKLSAAARNAPNAKARSPLDMNSFAQETRFFDNPLRY